MPQEWGNREDQGEYLGTGKKGSDKYQIPGLPTYIKYPGHFNAEMIEMYQELVRQIFMCMAYFNIPMECALDVLEVVRSDIKNNIRRGDVY